MQSYYLCFGSINLTVNEKENNHGHRLTLNILVLGLIVSAIIANSIIIFSDAHKKHSTSLWILNITGAIASSLAIIAVCRHGVHGLHGKSYVFLMLGIIFWFSADLTLMYYYYALGIEEQKLVSLTDAFWFAGYVFLALHLFANLSSFRRTVKPGIVIVVSIVTVIFVIYNILTLVSSGVLTNLDSAAFLVTVTYPVLDLILIIPSLILLVILWKDYKHYIPWLLSSLSLLVNAIADDGYVNEFVKGYSQNLWFWDLFYVTDFIIMIGALIWYNKFHISKKLNKAKIMP
jgi:hypothetical protein